MPATIWEAQQIDDNTKIEEDRLEKYWNHLEALPINPITGSTFTPTWSKSLNLFHVDQPDPGEGSTHNHLGTCPLPEDQIQEQSIRSFSSIAT